MTEHIAPEFNYTASPNPLLAKMKRRGGPRPKSKNTPRSTAPPSELRWVEPLAEPVNFPSMLEPFHFHEFAAEFELDPSLPETISNPHVEALEGLVFRTTGDDELVQTISPALTAQAHFKCARKLYGTLTDDAKSQLQPLKSIWYDDAEVPVSMAKLIDVIGNMDTKLGKFMVSHQRTLFLRWVAKGLTTAVDFIEGIAPGENDGDPESWVWEEPDSVKLIRDRANTVIRDLRDVTHHLTIPGQDDRQVILAASLPEYTEDSYPMTDHFDEEVREHWRRASLCLNVTISNIEENTTPVGTPPTVDLTTLLNAVHLFRRPDTYSMRAMRDQFIEFQSKYARLAKPHISAYFKMTFSPVGKEGSSAQLATSTDTYVESMLPLPDADRAMGFLLSPLRSIRFNPNIRAYSKKNKRAQTSVIISDDLKDIAH
jgi:hypothetical protein